MPQPTLVLDLDGTLVDTAADLVGTLNAILAREGLAELRLEQARDMIGAGARKLLERGLAANGVAVTPARVDALFADFLVHYEAHIADLSRPFPGAVEALDRFAAEGWLLAICSNKLEGLSRRLLGALGLATRFAAICGGDSFARPKPDALAFRQTVARAGGDPADAVMVGDSATDISTARAAGVPVVAVDFGYTPVPVAELDPDRVISHFDALHAAVAAVRRRPALA